MCHVSCVACHVSCVMCHLPCVPCFFCFFLCKKDFQSGGASRWRVCYQQGLPRLVFYIFRPRSLPLWRWLRPVERGECPTVRPGLSVRGLAWQRLLKFMQHSHTKRSIALSSSGFTYCVLSPCLMFPHCVQCPFVICLHRILGPLVMCIIWNMSLLPVMSLTHHSILNTASLFQVF